MKSIKLITILLFLCCSPTKSETQSKKTIYLDYINSIFVASVVKVYDGDTIEIRIKNDQTITLRFDGIDCPEKNQPYGMAAKKFVEKQILNEQIIVTSKELDLYGRLIADILINHPDPKSSLSRKLVKNGFAWHYKRYSHDKELSKAEKAARKKGLGLWKGKNPIAPWEWRKSN